MPAWALRGINRHARQHTVQAANLLGPLRASSIRVVGIANSKRMLLESSGVDLMSWEEDLAGNKARMRTRGRVVVVAMHVQSCMQHALACAFMPWGARGREASGWVATCLACW